MRNKIVLLLAVLLTFGLVCGFAPAPTYGLYVRFPKELEDERGRTVTQPVLVEIHSILTPALRMERIEPLEKSLRQTDSEIDKQKIQADIERLRRADSVIVATYTISPGNYQSFELPLGQYEVHFIPVNPPKRKPVVVRVTHQQSGTSVNVEVGPEGTIIGGGPSVADLVKRIDDQQKIIDELQERLKKLESK